MTGYITRTEQERFWAKVAIGQPDECWEWRAARGARGYGKFRRTQFPGEPGRLGEAHRYSWELANGRAPRDEMYVCHTCDNPPCVNPAHLYEGTATDNNRDTRRGGHAHFQTRTHCTRGHEWTPENTVLGRGKKPHHRSCKQCVPIDKAIRAERARSRYWAKKRAA